jgi:DNA polymerase-3 subunit epsilon
MAQGATIQIDIDQICLLTLRLKRNALTKESSMLPDSYLVLDVETANRSRESICQIGITMVVKQFVKVVRSDFINPMGNFESFNMSLHGITPKVVQNSKTFPEIYTFLASVLCKVPVFHHGDFDKQAIEQCCNKHQLPNISADWRNSMETIRKFSPELIANGLDLETLCKTFGINHKHHDAGEDSLATAQVLNLAVNKQSLSIPTHYLPSTPNISDSFGVVVFSGDMDKLYLSKLAEQKGYHVGKSVTRSTSILCLGDTDQRTIEAGNSISGKQKRAEELISKGQKLKILTENEFLDLIRN